MTRSGIVSAIIGFLVTGILIAFMEGNWVNGLLAFGVPSVVFLAVELTKKRTRKLSDLNLPDTDERVSGNIRLFLLRIFGLSLLILFVILAIFSSLNKNSISVNVLLLYVIATFFISFIGIGIVKKR
ncbi:UNVERIFIED_ORG: putative integral membrane protein [Heyndrickxia coagulans]